MNQLDMETKHATIEKLWGKTLNPPITYSYSWIHSSDKKENKSRALRARAKAIQHVLNYMGMQK